MMGLRQGVDFYAFARGMADVVKDVSLAVRSTVGHMYAVGGESCGMVFSDGLR